MQRCEHSYAVKFDLFSGIKAECTFCQDVKRLKKKYALIGYFIGFFITTLLLVLFEQLNVAHWLMLILIPSFILIYVIVSWLMYEFIAKECQRGVQLSHYFSFPQK